MVYTVTMNDSRIIRGNTFNCSFNWLLEHYKLSEKFAPTETIKVKSPGNPKFVTVIAADDKFYPSFRMNGFNSGNLEWRFFNLHKWTKAECEI
uniref:DUF5060 domain-containing protein n=1 Tax=Globodera pallida TaxID=36090 RepID=A0A183CLH6_GLOPA